MNFEQIPEYQRGIQKIARLDPTQRAILNHALADYDASWADKMELQRLRGMTAEADRTSREKRFDLSKKALNVSADIERKRLDAEAGDRNFAELISGAGVLSKGYFGHKQKLFGLKQAEDTRKLTRRLGLGG